MIVIRIISFQCTRSLGLRSRSIGLKTSESDWTGTMQGNTRLAKYTSSQRTHRQIREGESVELLTGLMKIEIAPFD